MFALYMPFRCPNLSLQKLPEEWLWDVLEEIRCSDPSSKLCATRRSAGIPFYIQVDTYLQDHSWGLCLFVFGLLIIVYSNPPDIWVSILLKGHFCLLYSTFHKYYSICDFVLMCGQCVPVTDLFLEQTL